MKKVIYLIIVILVLALSSSSLANNLRKSKGDNIIIKNELEMVTNYLLKCNEGYLLIDTGYEWDYEKFLKELEKNKVKVEEINYLLLTHHHDDHAGFVNDLFKDTELTVIAHKMAKGLLKTGENDKSRGGGYINKRIHFAAKIKKLLNPKWTLTFPPVYLRDSDILIEGDDNKILREIGIEGKILYTPGHTIDSISVLLDDGTLFCGDAAMSNSLTLLLGTKYHTIFITDLEKYYNSWEKLINSGAKEVYPSHGKAFGIEKLKENIYEYEDDSLVKFF